jgi:hypothetical protein
VSSRNLTRLLYGVENSPDSRAFARFAVSVWKNQISLVSITHNPADCDACKMNARKSCEDRRMLLQVALTPLVFLRQYWESMALHERNEWYSPEDLARVKEEASKVLGP